MTEGQALTGRLTSEQKYQKFVEKGARLHEMMLSEYDGSTTTDYQLEDLEKWGYKKDSDCKCGYRSCLICSIYMGTTATVRILDLGPASAGEHGGNYVVTHTHDNTYEIDGKKCYPTWGGFSQVINAEKGLLIAYDNETPEKALKDLERKGEDEETSSTLPELRHWSDVAYLQWLSVADKDSELRMVLRNNVINHHTKLAVREIESKF